MLMLIKWQIVSGARCLNGQLLASQRAGQFIIYKMTPSERTSFVIVRAAWFEFVVKLGEDGGAILERILNIYMDSCSLSDGDDFSKTHTTSWSSSSSPLQSS